ncbi:MAG: UvrD-helicase domain-containing protein, partial [Phycisphaeraceae bacterium JB051]
MDFLITNTFVDSMQKLTNDEQKAVKITVFDLQQDINHPGLRWHKIDKVRDPNFSSVSVNMDIRLIVYRSDKHLLICYVDHHDKAYRWATNRKIQAHPKTGAAQIVEVRETVKEIVVPIYVDKPVATTKANSSPKPLLADVSTDVLLSYGVPEEWIDDVRKATEDSILMLVEYLPQEAADALLELATGGKPQPVIKPVVDAEVTDPFLHPDAQRRFRVLANVEELERALEYPWEKWTVFLHPSQREIVEKQFNGPARVSGSAGTGKTIVALHRAVYLARQHKHARLLVTTFSDTLARALQTKLRRLVGNEPLIHERIEVQSIHAVGRQLYQAKFGKPKIVDDLKLQSLLQDHSSKAPEHRFADAFIWAEWQQVVDAWQLGTWKDYQEVQRLGRKTRLSENQRELLWGIFEQVLAYLDHKQLCTQASLMAKVAEHVHERKNGPYDFVVVDEAQDVGVAELRLLAAMGGGVDTRNDALFFAGDLGQRIFQPPFSWKSLGLDIRGRSRTLKINYRTSHQIRKQAD